MSSLLGFSTGKIFVSVGQALFMSLSSLSMLLFSNLDHPDLIFTRDILVSFGSSCSMRSGLEVVVHPVLC